ncbi:P-loop containing nucleoside triphosphate hydrolase protein [Choiromyces venosus 120613-1]|uniref:Origin recognition complex subunit 1 n=1 Tax=Choiromyces venosus 120613-1 TaxID=1336337 RepID=A0A3N4J7N5_9PEZI|nr:P-loop containing nucleoside triphosphate hydrolase protein [Choiromyces venosus 120613-1]
MAPSSTSPSPSLPSPSPPPPTKKKQPNLTRVRKILHSVQCEDSNDELGDEDLPWEWIHSGDPKVGDAEVGAKMGQFNIGIGDCVLIKGEGLQGEAYIGMICEFDEEERKLEDGGGVEMMVNIMSFSTEFEADVSSGAKVLSLQKFNEAYPAGEEVWKGRETDITAIGEMVYHGTKVVKMRENKPAAAAGQRRAKRHKAGGSGDDGEWDRELDDVLEDDPNFSHRTKAPCTTSKKRKSSSITTPTRRTPGGVSKKYTTPTHKRIVVKKPLLFTPLSTRTLSPGTHFEEEFSEVYTHLSAAIAEGTGSCIYISSTPGTGKTATIRELITQLQYLVALEELDDFTFVEINGMKVTDLHQAYSLLWEAIKGDRVSPSQALGLLESEFSTPSPRSVPCVVLMDELDELVTRGQSVMYNFFNWPGGWHSKLIVLAVANTMDLPERTLSNKISSRLGLTRITFPGYTDSQLMSIIQSRLEGVPGNIVDPDAVQFASRKVAAVSGDATRALDICRRAVEIVEYSSNKDTDNNQPPSSSSCRKSGAISPSNAIQEATSSPLQMFLKTTSLVSKIFITVLLLRSRRSGIGEGVLRDVLDEAERIVRAQGVAEEELGGGARVAGIKAAVRGLVEAGVVSVEKKGGGGGRVRFLIGQEEVKAALREDGGVGGVVGR